MSALTPLQADVLELVNELAGDWEYDGEVTLDTHFIADLELESLDLVVLGTMLQERYGKLPFSEYLAELGEMPVDERDLTAAELIEFIRINIKPVPAGGGQ
jgi:acyl carrier protein